MNERLSSHPIRNNFNVVTWNILLDKTRTKEGLIKPQSKRLPSQVETLRNLDKDLDVVAIQEAHVTLQQHNGEELARRLGFDAGFWKEHNTSKRRGDYIGMFGAMVEDAEFFDLPHDKQGVLTHVGKVAVAGYHFRNESIGPMRTDQARAMIERLECEAQAVVMGDGNFVPQEKPHKLLLNAGFESVFTLIGDKQPTTWPTRAYHPVFYPKGLRRVLPGFRYDNIYARGVTVRGAGTFVGDSDHNGLWANIES